MRLTAEARHRALSLVRHAAIAAGLGVGWLLLSGQSASADVLSVPSLPAVSNTVSTVESSVPTTSELPSSLPQVSDVQHAVSSGISRTTSTLASTVEAAPAVVAPVLTGPLEPLAPVVDQTASGVGTAVTTVGGSVAGTVDTPLPTPLPVAAPDPLPASSAAPAENAAAPVPAPAEQLDQAAAPRAPSDAVSPIASGSTPKAFDWSFWTKEPAQLANSAGAVPPASPADGPEQLQLPPSAPASTSGGSDGTAGGGPTVASLAGGFLLAVPLFFRGRRRPLSTLVPPTPAFDPGSTPD
jgi:hypothetical protein